MDLKSCQDSLFQSLLKTLRKKKKTKSKNAGGGYADVEPLYTSDTIVQGQKIAKHAHHVLYTVVTKRRSLDGAILSFRMCSDDSIGVLRRLLQDSTTDDSSDDDSLHQRLLLRALKVRVILCHWTRQYLRVQDAIIHLQTGECRHPADVRRSKTTSHPSRFSQERKRSDGYTSMYSAEHYSGYGWDELYDEDVGIASRMAVVLGKGNKDRGRKVWNRVLEDAVLFENALNEHELAYNALIKKVEEIRKGFVSSINGMLSAQHQQQNSAANENIGTARRSSGSARSSTADDSCGGTGRISVLASDKLERMELVDAKFWGIRNLQITRGGETFQIVDSNGVLPNKLTAEEWKIKMALPPYDDNAVFPKKQKLVQGREEVDTNFMPTNEDIRRGGGLTVKTLFVKPKKKQDKKNQKKGTSPVSLLKIKSKLGVDGERLQASREAAETETLGHSASRDGDATGERIVPGKGPDKAVDDDGPCDEDEVAMALQDICDTEEEISERRQVVLHCTRVVANLKKEGKDDDDVFDAQDELREAVMNLGIRIHDLYNIVTANTESVTAWKRHRSNFSASQSPVALLQEAESQFVLATRIVSELDVMLTSSPNRDDLEYKRTMLIYRSRAQVNVGMVLIEQAERKKQGAPPGLPCGDKREQTRTKLLTRAVAALKQAEGAAESLKMESSAKTTFMSHKERAGVLIDSFHALQLLSLARRWHGQALWELGQWRDSSSMLEKAAACGSADFPQCPPQVSSNMVREVKFQCLKEFYHAATCLVDLATSTYHREIQGTSETGGCMKALVDKAFQRAIAIRDRIRLDMSESVNRSICLEDEGLKTSGDLREALREFRRYCREREQREADMSSSSAVLKTAHKQIAGAAARPTNVPRSDLARGATAPAVPPSVRMTVTSVSRKRKRHKSKKVEERTITAEEVFDSVQPSRGEDSSQPLSTSSQGVKYRKWGDELLNQVPVEGGGTALKLIYPAIAPPMPPEVAKWFDEHGRSPTDVVEMLA